MVESTYSKASGRAIVTCANRISKGFTSGMVCILDKLEDLYTQGSVPEKEYEKTCQQLISQFKVAQAALKDKYPDFHTFWTEYQLDCSLAKIST